MVLLEKRYSTLRYLVLGDVLERACLVLAKTHLGMQNVMEYDNGIFFLFQISGEKQRDIMLPHITKKLKPPFLWL